MTVTTTTKVDLTDGEWMSLLDGERDGLPRCCANVSALRDVLMQVVRGGGEVDTFTMLGLERAFGWFVEGHDLPEGGALEKLARQVGLPLEVPDEHPKQGHE